MLLPERGGGDWLTRRPYHVLGAPGERGVAFQHPSAARAALPPTLAFLRAEGVETAC